MEKTMKDPKFMQRMIAIGSEAERLLLSIMKEGEVVNIREHWGEIDKPYVHEAIDVDVDCVKAVAKVKREDGRILYSVFDGNADEPDDDTYCTIEEFAMLTDMCDIFYAVAHIKGIMFS